MSKYETARRRAIREEIRNGGFLDRQAVRRTAAAKNSLDCKNWKRRELFKEIWSAAFRLLTVPSILPLFSKPTKKSKF